LEFGGGGSELELGRSLAKVSVFYEGMGMKMRMEIFVVVVQEGRISRKGSFAISYHCPKIFSLTLCIQLLCLRRLMRRLMTPRVCVRTMLTHVLYF